MGAGKCDQANDQNQPQPRPGAVRTLYQREGQQVSSRKDSNAPGTKHTKINDPALLPAAPDRGKCYQQMPMLTQQTTVKELSYYTLLDTKNQGGIFYDLRNQTQRPILQQ
jgi:hypothetical protein